MGVTLIKFLESERSDNRVLFYLDDGEKDLAKLYADPTIAIGSIAICPVSGVQWYLDANKHWSRTVINLETLAYNEGALTSVEDSDLEIPEIESVKILPASIKALPGSVIQMNARVNGANRITEDVIWSLAHTPYVDKNTKISADGLLTISPTQDKIKIEIRALSKDDLKSMGTAEVLVDPEFEILDPVVTGIVVSPKVLTQKTGNSVKFKAELSGRDISGETIGWKLLGATDSTISTDGIVTIGGNEKAAALIVQAYSESDNSICDIATIVLDAAADITPTGVTIQPQGVTLKRGTSLSLVGVAEGLKSNQEVIWTLETPGAAGTKISFNGYLTIDPAETLTSVKVKAVSCQDSTVFAEQTYTVLAEDDDGAVEVGAVTFIRRHEKVQKNGRAGFAAVVSGKNLKSGLVKYSVDNNTSEATRISQNGVLSIAVEEQAKSLLITATSIDDPSKKDIVVVVVLPMGGIKTSGGSGGGTGGSVPEVNSTPVDTYYVRGINPSGAPEWKPVKDLGFVTDAPTTENDAIYGRKTVNGKNVWAKINGETGIVCMTKAEWNALSVDKRPDFVYITDHWLVPNRMQILDENGKLL